MTLHAGCVDFEGRGVLITGPSGAGKSSLALQLMGFGGRLVADDQLRVRATAGGLIASAPPGLPHLIEARGIGLLRAELYPETTLHLWVELTQRQGPRLPQLCDRELLNHRLELVSAPLSCHLGAAIRQYIRCGRES
ncbi:HPr kinase/phosphorylase [Falsigemmobacter faecalis]|uniref:HPr kinase/phosphorylase n=1 Tax=Falsigemmobacter faecalis TaxID=2488730 RepID=UPI001315AC8D|nr:HPr kinase/phosphatase C-terminal domain-containing protein [Falsigemmobacter faecalis]